MPRPVTDSRGLIGDFSEAKFRIERVVAEGGFGVVYQGTHVALDPPVAVKALKTPAHLSELARKEFIDAFVLEAKTIARIKHPHIVQVLDTGVATTKSGERVPWTPGGYLLHDERAVSERQLPIDPPAYLHLPDRLT